MRGRIALVVLTGALFSGMAVPSAPATGTPAVGEISTVVGGGLGEEGPARPSWVRGVESMTVAPDGAVIFADQGASRVRRIDAGTDGVVTGDGDDVVTTIAGNGDTYPEVPPDGALATEVALPFPESVLSLPDGSVLVGASDRIFRVGTDGRIWLFAGGRTASFEDRGDGGPAIDALINRVTALYLAGDRLYVGEYEGIRVIDMTTGIIERVAGRLGCGFGADTGDGGHPLDACFRYAQGFAFDDAGNLLVTDEFHLSVRRITPGLDGVVNGGPGEQITRVAGTGGYQGGSGDGGHPLQAVVRYPQDVTLDGAGRLVVGTDGRVIRIDPGADGLIDASADETLTVLAGDGPIEGPARDGRPARDAAGRYMPGVLIDAHGRLLVGEQSPGSAVSHIDDDGTFRYVAGLGAPLDGRVATDVHFGEMDDVAPDRGDLYVLQTEAGLIRRVEGNSGVVSTVAGGGTVTWTRMSLPTHPTDADFQEPSAFAVGPDGSLWITDNRVLLRITPGADGRVDGGADERIVVESRSVVGPSGLNADAGWAILEGVTVAHAGDVYVMAERAVYRLGTAGLLVRVAGSGIEGTSGDCDATSCPPAREATFDSLGDIAIGPNGRLYVADRGAGRIRVVTPGADGVVDGDDDEHVSTVVGACRATSTCDPAGSSGGHPNQTAPGWPTGFDVSEDGDLWFVEELWHTVRHVTPGADGVVDGSPDEVVVTAAGLHNKRGLSGDGGPASDALLRHPLEVEAAPGAALVIDYYNDRIRRIER